MRFCDCQLKLHAQIGVGTLHDSEYDIGFVSNAFEGNWGDHHNHEVENPVGTGSMTVRSDSPRFAKGR